MKKSSKVSNLQIIESGNKYGNMNLSPRFYPENFTKEEIKKEFNLSREKLGLEYGFDGHKIYIADQLDKKGTYFEITNEYAESYPEGWTDIKEDILVMNENVKGVAIGHSVADCPVVVAYDRRQKVVAIAHCGGRETDLMIPAMTIDALASSYNSKANDIIAYISAGADKDSYLYETYPNWIKNEKLWDGKIIEDENGLFHIDLKGTIEKELLERKIDKNNITMSKVDTITNDGFYSNYAEAHGNKEKAGRNFAGACFVRRR